VDGNARILLYLSSEPVIGQRIFLDRSTSDRMAGPLSMLLGHPAELALCPDAKWRERFCILIVNLQGRFDPQLGSLTVTDMDARSNFGAAKILCVESDVTARESRCAVPKYSCYDAASASPHLAEIVLRSKKFDLIVLSSLRDSDLHWSINLSDGADVLVLGCLTMPSELLSLISQRLNRHERRA
jgi:hypothetical protein